MTALSIQPTFPTFTGADGQPLENGYIWIGTANLNPITNPITVYWDAALSAPATQPIRTLGGYPSNSGTPARMYVNSDYSIQVLDRKGSVVYSAPVATERYGGGIINAADVVYDPAGTGAVATTVQAQLRKTIFSSNFPTLQEAITSLSAWDTLHITGTNTISASLTITNKSHIRLTGPGSITLSGAASGAYIFQLVGTVDDLEIDHLTLVGDGNAGYGQTAIGNASGQTISNVRFHDNNISSINVGISLNANSGGSYTKAVVRDNYLFNILGTVSGSGYGIHMAQATQVLVTGNIIDNASRHSIYCGRADVGNIVISDNLILNHRSTVSDSSYRCALVVSRSNNVTVSGNKLYNTYDGGMEISHDTATGVNCYNVNVVGNTFTSRRTVNADIIIGEQAIPTSYKTANINISDNVFEEDVSVSGNGISIQVLNGTDINIRNNMLSRKGVTATLSPFVSIGNSAYTSSVSHLNNITVKNNACNANNSVGGSYSVYVSTQGCTGTTALTVKDNELYNFAGELGFEAIPTNPNSKYKFRFTHAYTSGAAQAANTCIPVATPSANGIKPTSQVVIRQEYYAGPNGLMYSGFAQDNDYNAMKIYCANVTVGALTVPTQTFICYVEDI